MKTCSVVIDGFLCERVVKARGLCGRHYNEARRLLITDTCRVIIEGKSCNRIVASAGLCKTHYDRSRNGLPLADLDYKEKKCSVEIDGVRCDYKNLSHEMCRYHYQLWREGKSVLVVKTTHKIGEEKCSIVVDGTPCEKTRYARGMCTAHYAQEKRGKPFCLVRSRPIEEKSYFPDNSPIGKRCSVVIGETKCDRKARRVGLCVTHYKMKRDGKPMAVINGRRSSKETIKRNSLGEKMCTRCGLWKHTDLFAGAITTIDKLNPICRECSGENSFEWRKTNSDATRIYHLKGNYQMSIADWESLFDSQGRRCACCDTEDSGGRGWMTDHDHSCCAGKISCGRCVRGILCCNCNLSLGGARDSVQILNKMIGYLKAWKK